ncbi:GrpE nucleotide exchange factor [Dimargaris cristalligena]|uniref:GrpE protein homolog, mitochondrial n=1 Tax=Dimargaris cristalligena TaxID=215637 RepID=A0A4P9ZYK7_9FUNG|nr:GrpE nucleotide exchange factor [Dimargaris cristalligena]|eukprot:RKP38824.1 GrpE nucleotide exchange factor [Dimargaris cristalligena]
MNEVKVYRVTRALETKSTSTDQATAASEGEAKKAEATGKPSAEKQLAELKDHYLRCLADMENLRQRTKVEVEKSSKFAIHKFAKELLDTVDILSMALNAVPEDHRADSANHAHLSNLYDGVNMTQSELLKTLKRHGVEPFSPMDEAFDPNKHQAMYQVTIPGKAPGTVISVEKSGYLLHGRVMRPAQVGITKIEN